MRIDANESERDIEQVGFRFYAMGLRYPFVFEFGVVAENDFCHDIRVNSLDSRAQNFRLLMSLTSVVWRARKRATRMARPTATSAAATVMIKKTKTCTL